MLLFTTWALTSSVWSRKRLHSVSSDLWPWSESLDGESELLYMPFLEHQLNMLESLGAKELALDPEMSLASNPKARMGSRLFEVEGLFRRVRMSYFDGGDSIQVFNSLWYPSFDRLDAPLLGIDLLSFGKAKLLCVIDAQPPKGRDADTTIDTSELEKIHAKYESLKGTPSSRWYEDNRYFSPQMLYGTFVEDDKVDRTKVKTDLFPAFCDYLKAYVDVVQEAHVDHAYDGKSHQKDYDTFNAKRDPAAKLFKSYFGPHFAETFVHDFLFALDDAPREEDALASQ